MESVERSDRKNNKKILLFNTLFIPNYKSFWLFWYIYFIMYLDIIYVKIHNMFYVPKKLKQLII